MDVRHSLGWYPILAHSWMRWYISSSRTVHVHQYALPVMPEIPGAFIGAAVNSASWTSHFVTSWYSISSTLYSRSMGGSSESWGCGGKRVDLSKRHLSLCETAGVPLSPLDRAGDVYTHFPFVHFLKFHMLCTSASSVSFR